jgi:hypothetical protein
MFLFLTLVNFYILVYAFSQSKNHKICHLALGFNLMSFVILYILTMDFPLIANTNALLLMIRKFQSLPVKIYVIIFFLILTGSISLLYREKKSLKESITRASIKESIDNLPMGLCFSTKNGIVLLSNRSMNQLCHKITGRELQDGEFFWQKVMEKRRKFEDSLEVNRQIHILQLNNVEIWSFSRNPIKVNNKDGVQITATNITELFGLRSQLKKKNLEFMKMNSRLHQYSENLSHIKSKEERLATKTQLHNELGYILLATRRALVNKELDKECQSILALWKKNIAALLSGRGLKEKSVFEELLEAALDIGIELKLKGKLPQESENKDLILKAAIEALNNAVRHAGATELNLTIKEVEEEYTIELTNNGSSPEKEIIEGGGLSVLRERIEGRGGIMGIDIEPIFKLWIRFPRGREVDNYD